MNGTLEIGGEVFKTKKDAAARARAILYSYPLGVHLNDVDQSFMSSLLLHHPRAAEKIAGGVRGIRVDAGLHGTRCFILVRHDDSETDFSFLRCLSPSSHLQDLRSAMRAAIQDQARAVRAKAFAQGPILCPVSGDLITSESAHVDHTPPLTFVRLVDDFLVHTGIDPATVGVGGYDDGEMEHYLTDSWVERTWAEYHLEHAKLRVISARANLSDVRRGLG